MSTDQGFQGFHVSEGISPKRDHAHPKDTEGLQHFSIRHIVHEQAYHVIPATIDDHGG